MTLDMYTLHYAPDNASMIIRLALEHVRAAYESVLVDRRTGEQSSASYLALNPNGLIPALGTPDGVLFETAAILLHLSDKHPGLFPAPCDPSRPYALKWFIFCANTVHPNLRILFYPHKYIDGDTTALTRKTQSNLMTHLGMLDTHLACEKAPMATQFYIAACLRWSALYGPQDHAWFSLAALPNLQNMVAALEPTDCVLATCNAEGLGKTPFTNPNYPNPPEGSAL